MKPKPEMTRTFAFKRIVPGGSFYIGVEGNQVNICVKAIKKLFKTEASRIRIVGSFAKPSGKGWLKVMLNRKTGRVIVSGRTFEMLWSLEHFLTELGAAEKPFYVRLEK